MAQTSETPYGAGGPDPLGYGGRWLPPDHHLIDTPGGSLFSHPPDGVGCFLASMPPLHNPPAGYGVESPLIVPPPYRSMSRETSSRRPLWSRRGFDVSPVPSPLIRSKQEESYRDNRSPDENIRSPRFHSPLRRSKPVPFPKRSRLEDGRKGSLSGGHCYNDDEGSGSRGRYDDVQHTQELGYPTNCDRRHDCLGGSKRNSIPHGRDKRSLSVERYSSPRGKSPPMSFSVQQHLSPRGKQPFPMPMEMSPRDDGSKSPWSPTDHCEDGQYIQNGSHDDHQGGTSDFLDSTSGCYDDSGIVGRSGLVGRESNFTEKKVSAYDALVDDFMAAVSKSCYSPAPKKTVDEEAYQKQTNRFAELALKRYNQNRNNKVKYALVEATVSSAIFEDSEIYDHVNFYAKAKSGPRKNSGKVLVFAELHHIGRRPNAMALTCFRFLDENNQFCGRQHQVRSSTTAQDIDHCYACNDRVKHPDGSCYKAGHVVDMLCYHYN